MKQHTTNYTNTFISIAEDSPKRISAIPITKPKKTHSIAAMQYEMIANNPYKFTSDEVLFAIHCERKDITESQKNAERVAFFSKGQACFRASPLAKTYGFGFHFDSDSKVSLIPMESEEYEKLSNDVNLKQVKAMRSKKA